MSANGFRGFGGDWGALSRLLFEAQKVLSDATERGVPADTVMAARRAIRGAARHASRDLRGAVELVQSTLDKVSATGPDDV